MFLRGLALCQDAEVTGEEAVGDPTELALLQMAVTCGIRKKQSEQQCPRIGERSFELCAEDDDDCASRRRQGFCVYERRAGRRTWAMYKNPDKRKYFAAWGSEETEDTKRVGGNVFSRRFVYLPLQ